MFKDFCYKKHHFLLADKGYSFIRQRGFTLISPKRATKEDFHFENKLNTMNSNLTREVTAVRNVVEHIIGEFKTQYKKLVSI